MPCRHIALPNGASAIVCGSRLHHRQCSGCGKPADLLCDWKVKSRRSGTCDKPICAACTYSPAPEKDLCPRHAAEWQARSAQGISA